jgi:hypothetical protein
MKKSALDAWLTQSDDELVETLATELRQHLAKLERKGGFYAYAVLSLAGDSFKLQYLLAAFNRETDIPAEHDTEVYYRLSPDEWANYGLDVFPKSAQIVAARNAEFGSLHQNPNPDDFTLDRYQIGHISRLHRSILKAMKIVRDEGAFGGKKSFAILWAPDSPDDVLFCSAKALNLRKTFKEFWREFGDEFVEMDCDRFE